jgi:hypothetical protein
MMRFLLPLAGTVLLSACAEVPPMSDTPNTPAPGSEPSGLCDAATLGWTVGKLADETLVHRAHAESGARIVRVLRPGQMVTMEYSEHRLNIYVDAHNRVERYSCS